MNNIDLGHVLVTGGSGFIGSHLVKRLVDEKCKVRVFDNNSRGSLERLGDYADKIEFIEGDITKYDSVLKANDGIDTVFHLAYINGTENFYNFPDKVLEVGVKGAINTIDAAIENDVKRYIVTSSSEVYQQPTTIPTAENERLIIPDIHNPRFSYSGGKMITELLTLHFAARKGLHTIICRPHNFYGPNMGKGHVIPQFILRLKDITDNFTIKIVQFPIQGTGEETRAFCYVDDAIDGLMLCAQKGESGNIYHLGTDMEVTIAQLARIIAAKMNIEIQFKHEALLTGGTNRRCPDISKIKKLGYSPKISLEEGIAKTIEAYI